MGSLGGTLDHITLGGKLRWETSLAAGIIRESILKAEFYW